MHHRHHIVMPAAKLSHAHTHTHMAYKQPPMPAAVILLTPPASMMNVLVVRENERLLSVSE